MILKKDKYNLKRSLDNIQSKQEIEAANSTEGTWYNIGYIT